MPSRGSHAKKARKKLHTMQHQDSSSAKQNRVGPEKCLQDCNVCRCGRFLSRCRQRAPHLHMWTRFDLEEMLDQKTIDLCGTCPKNLLLVRLPFLHWCLSRLMSKFKYVQYLILDLGINRNTRSHLRNSESVRTFQLRIADTRIHG